MSPRRLRSHPTSLALAVGISCLWSDGAQASCVAPEPAVLWSYPADGASEVPTNADLFVSGPQFSLPTLNGEPLELNSNGGYELGDLEPNTAYEVLWSDLESPLSVSFTTGAGPWEAAEPTLNGSVSITRNPSGAPSCALVPSQGCFDTGPPARIRFDAGTVGVAWLVDILNCDGSSYSLLWPAECGAPIIETTAGIACVSLRATDGVQLSEATETVCSTPELPPGASLPTSSACTGPWPPAEVRTFVSADNVIVSSLDPVAPNPTGTGGSAAGTAGTSAAPANDDGASPALMGIPSSGASGCSLSREPERRGVDWGIALLVAAALVSRRKTLGSA